MTIESAQTPKQRTSRAATRKTRRLYIVLAGMTMLGLAAGLTLFAMRDSLAIIQSLGVPVSEIRASGGGSKSPLWRQIQADVFGQDVVTINAEQGPAYGVALLAAVGAGAFENVEEACEATIFTVKKTPLNKAAAKVYDRAFPLYQQLYRSLEKDFEAISGLEG